MLGGVGKGLDGEMEVQEYLDSHLAGACKGRASVMSGLQRLA